MTFLPGDAEVTIEVNPTSLEAEKLRLNMSWKSNYEGIYSNVAV